MTHKMFKEVEHYFKTYSMYLENQTINDNKYIFSCNKNEDLLSDLLKFKKLIKQDKVFPVIKRENKDKTKVYINTDVGYRLFLSKKNVLQNKKKLPKKLILDYDIIKYKKIFFDILTNLNKIYATKYFNYIYFDIKSYYLNISIDLVNKAIDYLSIKRFGKVTHLVNNIKKNIKNNENYIFIDGKYGLYLGNYINKLLAYFVSLYIAFKIDAKVIIFFEDDFLLLYKKDKRIDIIKKYKKIITFLRKYGFKINLDKSKMGIFGKNELSFLGYSFKKNSLYISDKKITEKKYKIIGIILSMRIEKNKWVNKKQLFRKLKNSINGFRNYYYFSSNIDQVIREIIFFIKKAIRYYYKTKTGLDMFYVNKYLNNKIFDYLTAIQNSKL